MVARINHRATSGDFSRGDLAVPSEGWISVPLDLYVVSRR